MSTWTPTNAETAGFDRLPAEIITVIYQHLESPQTAFELSRTSKQLRSVWGNDKTSILVAIQQRTVRSYSAAHALAETQQYVFSALNQVNAPHPLPPTPMLTSMKSIERHIHDDDQIIHYLRECWLSYVSPDLSDPLRRFSPHRNPPYMTDNERDRFAYAAYRVLEFAYNACLSSKGDRDRRQAIILDIPLDEHWLLCEVCFFFMFHRNNIGDPGFDILPFFSAHASAHTEFSGVIEAYRQKLQSAGHSGMLAVHLDCPRSLFMGMFDDHQERLRQMAADIYQGRRVDD